LINQELASGELLERSLLALDSEAPPDADEVEREGRSIEVIRHGKPGEGDSEDDATSQDVPASGEMLFF